MARYGDWGSVDIPGTASFSVNNRPVLALLDPVYEGAVLATKPIGGLIDVRWRGRQLDIPGTRTSKIYNTDRLYSIGSVFLTFGGKTVCRSAELVRYDLQFGSSGFGYDALIGRGVLSHLIVALDLRNMTMWVARAA